MFLGLFSQTTMANLSGQTNFNVDRYLGRWYEVGAIPNSYQKGCTCTQANYKQASNEHYQLNVDNRCKKNGKWADVQTMAYPDYRKPSQWKVKTFWLFSTSYWVIYADSGYRYALVSKGNSRNHLWLLARNPNISKAQYNKLLNIAKSKGFDVNRIQPTTHKDCR